MSERIYSLIDGSNRLLKSALLKRANCFNAVKFFFGDTNELTFLGPEEYVTYLGERFKQVNLICPKQKHDVIVVWSRTADSFPIGEIKISNLKKSDESYPFGLVIEHSFVRTKEELIFQKRDPSNRGPYELLKEQVALQPYSNLNGYELTLHRKL